MVSTFEFPLRFFDKCLTNEQIEFHYRNFKDEFSLDYGSTYKVEGFKLILDTEYMDWDSKLKTVYIELDFQTNYLEGILDKELDKTYTLIDEIIEKYHEGTGAVSLKNKIQVKVINKIDALIENRKDLLSRFPIFLTYFERILNYVNFHCKKYIDEPFFIDKAPISENSLDDIKTTIDKIFQPIELGINQKKIANSVNEFEGFKNALNKFYYDKNYKPEIAKFSFKFRPESKLKYMIGRYIKYVCHHCTIEEVIDFVGLILINVEQNKVSYEKHYNDKPGKSKYHPIITDNYFSDFG